MATSVFDLFTIGIGPSSSHVVGPMRAVALFLSKLRESGQLVSTHRIGVDLFGSLAHTGKGHGTDKSIVLGLLGESPETVDTGTVDGRFQQCRQTKRLELAGEREIDFSVDEDIRFHYDRILEKHSNGLMLQAYGANNELLCENTYYSVGGGFVLDADQEVDPEHAQVADKERPYPFKTANELLDLCQQHGLSIDKLMLANEAQQYEITDIQQKLLTIWRTMEDCIDRGMQTEGILPGPLKVRRRAPQLYHRLKHQQHNDFAQIDWVNLYAIAVNEENAAGGRVVTAPTNGAAGILPAVLKYHMRFYRGDKEDVVRYLLTAAAIGILFKENASISGAEVGCQGEVGSACSMAAAGLCAVTGGSPEQVENAAEIAMEHHLGLTCDPIGGLVQIPCIERNAMAAVQAINAVRIAMYGNGRHYVSLDKVIKTMRDTGQDMSEKYKETARGGLAVNIIEC